ncbi:MAG: GAF domain-containing protein [bacterium]|nr:GAF domain-containing protein [bacterium]
MTDETAKPKKQTNRRPAAKPRAPRKTAGAVESDAIVQLRSQLEEKVGELTDSNRQLKRKIFDLYTIFEISRNFNAVLKYQSLLDTFIFTCLGQVGALKGGIFLKGEECKQAFCLVKSKGSGSFPTQGQAFREQSKLIDYITRLNRPVLVQDLVNEVAEEHDLEILQHFHSGIIVPLIYQTRLIGLFAMSDKISGREFQLDDLEFLSILGNQIAVAIENARLYEAEKMATTALREAQQQLLQTERLAALGQMSASIAHEVNNPLGIIKNYLLLIRRSIAENPSSMGHLGVVEGEIDRIASIVRQLLDFHRPQPMEMNRVDLNAVIEDVLSFTGRLLESAGVEIEQRLPHGPYIVMGSVDSLKQVFLNLLINARDAMPDGGKVILQGRRTDHQVVIEVCDTGPGIPADVAAHIFEPFFTTKEVGKGTGLGLSVCYGIIKSHNGSITFRNLNPGSCFEITLPAAKED